MVKQACKPHTLLLPAGELRRAMVHAVTQADLREQVSDPVRGRATARQVHRCRLDGGGCALGGGGGSCARQYQASQNTNQLRLPNVIAAKTSIQNPARPSS